MTCDMHYTLKKINKKILVCDPIYQNNNNNKRAST